MRIFFIIVMLFFSTVSQAQSYYRVVADSLYYPWEIIYGHDDHIWFTQKNGYICRLEPNTGHLDTLYRETLSSESFGEGGMLGMALHPSFATDPYVFVTYCYSLGGPVATAYRERVVRYTYSNNALGNPLILIDSIKNAGYHAGSRLTIIGDKLFVTTGDGGFGPEAQNLNDLRGKTLRVNLDGTIPPDNPIPNSPIWSWGHRNSQGMVYANNILYQSEHGDFNDDEINIVKKGRNYGYPYAQGYCDLPTEVAFCNDSNVIEPLITWSPTVAVCGMDYYNHAKFPALQNCLLLTTLKGQTLYKVQLNTTFDSIVSAKPWFQLITDTFYSPFPPYDTTYDAINLRDLCIAPDGRIFVSTSRMYDRIIEINRTTVLTDAKDPAAIASIAELSPNPTNGTLTLTTSEEGIFRLKTMEGREVFRYRVSRGANRIVLPNGLARGLYLASFFNSKGEPVLTKKIIYAP